MRKHDELQWGVSELENCETKSKELQIMTLQAVVGEGNIGGWGGGIHMLQNLLLGPHRPGKRKAHLLP